MKGQGMPLRRGIPVALCIVAIPGCGRPASPPRDETTVVVAAPVATGSVAAPVAGGDTPAPPDREPEQPSPEMVALGKRLFLSNGCSSCHDPTEQRVGPRVHALRGSRVTLVDGSEVTVTPAYVRRAILEPTLEIVQGYGPAMPSFKRWLTPVQVDALVAYVLSL